MSCNSEEYVKYPTFCMKLQPHFDPWETDIHVHTVEEMILVCSEGCCSVINNGHTYKVPTPAIIWNRLGSFHVMSQIDDSAEAYIVCFHPQFTADLPKHLLHNDFIANYCFFALSLTATQTDRIRQLYLTLKDSPSFQRKLLLPCLFDQITRFRKDSQVITGDSTCDYILDVVDFLQHHWSEKLKIPELAEAFHVGTTKLKKDFKHITAETLHGYQLRMQLQAARSRLNSTDLSLVQIAMECGFTDESHLIRSFRKKLGMTPGEFRSRYQQRWNQ